MEPNNEISITINVSDDLLKRVMGLYATINQPQQMGIPASLLGALAGPPPKAPAENEGSKPAIGFGRENVEKNT